MCKTPTNNSSSGLVYVFVLFLMLIMLGLALTLSHMVKREMQVRRNFLQAKRTFSHAQAGVALGLAQVKKNGSASSAVGCLSGACDIDDDGMTDFMVSYYPSGQTLRSSGYNNALPGQTKLLEVQLSDSGIDSALQVGGNIICSGSKGAFTGGIRYGGSNGLCNSDPFVFTATGPVTQESGMVIPTPSFDDPSFTDYADVASTIGGVNWAWNVDPTFVYVDTRMEMMNLTMHGIDYSSQGSLIVVQNLNMDLSGDVTINPHWGMPALVVGGTLSISNADNLIINGVVYADSVHFSNISGSVVINGALVVKNDLILSSVNDFTVNYNPLYADPPFFSGVGNTGNLVRISHWREI